MSGRHCKPASPTWTGPQPEIVRLAELLDDLANELTDTLDEVQQRRTQLYDWKVDGL